MAKKSGLLVTLKKKVGRPQTQCSCGFPDFLVKNPLLLLTLKKKKKYYIIYSKKSGQVGRRKIYKGSGVSPRETRKSYYEKYY
nr:MAG TPA: hypothetical protein [Caudoviricetes sp.]